MIKKNNSISITIYILSLKIFIILCIILLIVPFSHGERKIKEVRDIKHEGFVLKKVDSHYEPEEKYYKSFLLPDTDIKVGVFRYITKEGDDTGRLGFLIHYPRFTVSFNPRPRTEGDLPLPVTSLDCVSFNPRPRTEGDLCRT